LRKIFLFCHHSAKICSHKPKKLILTHKHEKLHNCWNRGVSLF
jgi:hypothetical protein